jgi:UDP-glucose 4-epimerase
VLVRRNIGKLSGRAFNIGGGPGNTVSLLELIKRPEELLERPVQLSFDAWRVGDQRYYVSDTSRFGAATGWHVTDPAKRSQLGAAAQRRAAEFGAEATAAAYAEVYRSLLAGGARAVA